MTVQAFKKIYEMLGKIVTSIKSIKINKMCKTTSINQSIKHTVHTYIILDVSVPTLSCELLQMIA